MLFSVVLTPIDNETYHLRFESPQQILTTMMTRIVVDKSTDHTKAHLNLFRLRIRSAIASLIHSYVDPLLLGQCTHVMTTFMINDRTDALKTDVNLFFTITNF